MASHETTEAARSSRDLALRWSVGIGVGVLFTWLAARSWPVDKLFGGSLEWAPEFAATLQLRGGEGLVSWSLSLGHLLAYAGILTLIHGWRVLRWLPLVRPFAPVPLAVLNRIGAVGFMGVFLLPLRLGELVRPTLLARDGGVPFGTGLSMIAVERISDGLMVTLMLFGVLLTVPETALERSPEVRQGAYAALTVFGSAMIGLVLTAVARNFTKRLLELTVGRLSGQLASRIHGLLTTFIDGLRVLGSPGAIASFVLLTAGYWLTNGFGIWVMARGLGLEVPVTAGYAMMCCVVVGMMIPNSPGNVGSFWYFLLLPMGLYAIDADSPRAIAFALLVWLAQLLQTSLFGAWGTWARGRARVAAHPARG
ncbi:MAG: hypothetical protein RIT45_275 [Pseudomonadota bacterium]|jgi:hypothetical protein